MIKPNSEGVRESIAAKDKRKRRMVFNIEEEYYDLFVQISSIFGRDRIQELRLMIARRALEVGLPPPQDPTLYYLLKEYKVYPVDGNDS